MNKIDYDLAKNIKNIHKHGLSFETAAQAFNDPNAQTIYDDYHSMTEDRYILLGAVGSHILLVIYTMRDEKIRMISARPATKREEEMYYKSPRGLL